MYIYIYFINVLIKSLLLVTFGGAVTHARSRILAVQDKSDIKSEIISNEQSATHQADQLHKQIIKK